MAPKQNHRTWCSGLEPPLPPTARGWYPAQPAKPTKTCCPPQRHQLPCECAAMRFHQGEPAPRSKALRVSDAFCTNRGERIWRPTLKKNRRRSWVTIEMTRRSGGVPEAPEDQRPHPIAPRRPPAKREKPVGSHTSAGCVSCAAIASVRICVHSALCRHKIIGVP